MKAVRLTISEGTSDRRPISLLIIEGTSGDVEIVKEGVPRVESAREVIAKGRILLVERCEI